MGKIIKFNVNNNNNNENKNNINQSKNQSENSPKKVSITKETNIINLIVEGIEEYVLYNFAVKEVLGINFIYRDNEKGEIGVLGVLAYEHKRKPGSYIAEFIAKGYLDKRNNKVIISELAFKQGEPDLYNVILKTLKAKKILPQELK